MIRLNQIERGTRQNKPLDAMDFKIKEAFNSFSARSNQIMKIQNNTLRFRFLVRIKFVIFTYKGRLF